MRQHRNTVVNAEVNSQSPLGNKENMSVKTVTYHKAVYPASFKEMKQTSYILFIKTLHMAMAVQRSTTALPAETGRLLIW